MATKAQRFKADAQKAAHSKNSPGTQGGRPRAAEAKTARARAGAKTAGATPRGQSALERAAPRQRRAPSVANPAGHNTAPRAAKNSSYEFEVSATTRPSRKSTRKSPTHVKTDSSLRIAAMNKTTSPQARASRRSGD
jgi:hypothetical protein